MRSIKCWAVYALACSFLLAACEEENYESDTGLAGLAELNYEAVQRIVPGWTGWARVPGSWVGGACTYCAYPAGSTVTVEDDGCVFNMHTEGCACMNASQVPLGELAGCWCYGTATQILSNPNGACGDATGPGWPPPHGGP